MKRFLSNLLCFAPGCAALYLVFLVAWGEWAPRGLQRNLYYRRGGHGHLLSRLQEARTAGPVDVLVIGSSHAYRGFDPRIFAQRGYTLFNLGSSAQTPMHSLILLQRHVQQIRPRLVVWEVFPATFTIDGVEATLDLIANGEHDEFTRDLVRHHRHIAVYHNYLFSLYRRWTRRDARVVEAVEKEGDVYVSGGYVESRKGRQRADREIREGSRTWAFREEHFTALRNGIEFLRAQGIPTVLVQTPVTPSFRAAYLNNDEFDRRVAGLAPHVNFNGMIQLDGQRDFLDANHLAQPGVQMFNPALIDWLEAGGWLMPPAR